MPVYPYGQSADMAAFPVLAQQHGLGILEDAARAHALSWNGQPVGTFVAFPAFSLYPTKKVTSGEGGMASTQDKGVAWSVRLLRNQGM
ncbi:hypothetical protein GCM10009670_25950 [Citricoccus alkalitolerans]